MVTCATFCIGGKIDGDCDVILGILIWLLWLWLPVTSISHCGMKIRVWCIMSSNC